MWYHRQLFHGRQSLTDESQMLWYIPQYSGSWGRSCHEFEENLDYVVRLSQKNKQTSNKNRTKKKPKIVWKVKIKKVDTPNRVNTIWLVPSFHEEWKCREEDMWNALPHAYMDLRDFKRPNGQRNIGCCCRNSKHIVEGLLPHIMGVYRLHQIPIGHGDHCSIYCKF